MTKEQMQSLLEELSTDIKYLVQELEDIEPDTDFVVSRLLDIRALINEKENNLYMEIRK